MMMYLKGNKILVVDDEDGIRFSFHAFLKDWGYQVELASNINEAKNLISKENFQIAIVDRILSQEHDGVELLKYLQKTQPQCQKILISGTPTFESAKEAIDYKVFSYLKKPVRKAELKKVIQRSLHQYYKENNYKLHESLFQSVVSYSPHPIVLCDLREKTPYANHAFYEIFGYKKPLKSCLSYVPDWDREETQEEIDNLLSGKEILPRETKRLSADGEQIDVISSISICCDQHGEPSKLLFLLRDIRNLKTMEKQLIKAQRLENIASLVAGIAHDFSNLLFVIRGSADILSLDKDPDDPEWEDIERIDAASESGMKLIRQLLQIGKEDEEQISKISINQILDKLKFLLRKTIQKKIDLEFFLEENLDLVKCNANQIEQAFLNISINARDAILENKGKKNKITFTTKNITLNKKKGSLEIGKYVLTQISDSGIGISENIRERIFDPFFSTKKSSGGTGLGLAMVSRIIKNHRGEIFVESDPGKGTCFEIYLPSAV